MFILSISVFPHGFCSGSDEFVKNCVLLGLCIHFPNPRKKPSELEILLIGIFSLVKKYKKLSIKVILNRFPIDASIKEQRISPSKSVCTGCAESNLDAILKTLCEITELTSLKSTLKVFG